MLRYDENSNTLLEQEMLTFAEQVLGGNPLQWSSSWSEPDLEPIQEFVYIANDGSECLTIVSTPEPRQYNI
jgi:hypothetical protein